MPFTKIIEAKKVLQEAVDESLSKINNNLAYNKTFKLSDLMLPPFAIDKSKAYIYVFSSTSAGEIKEYCRKAKAKNKEIKLPLISKQTTNGDCLYVGSSTTGITKRIKEHLGFGHDATYSLQLQKWASKIKAEVTLKIYEFEGAEQDIVQLLEDSLHFKLSPALGKRGGK